MNNNVGRKDVIDNDEENPKEQKMLHRDD